MKLYGLKNCDTCRKALKYLPDAQFIDVRNEGVPESILIRALDQFGVMLVNKRSTTWRELAQSERDLPPHELIKAHPTVMKRPLIVRGNTMWLGWSADTQAALAD